MTGRKAYGDYDVATTDRGYPDRPDPHSDGYEDPLVELARIVSEGDDFLHAEKSGPASESDRIEPVVHPAAWTDDHYDRGYPSDDRPNLDEPHEAVRYPEDDAAGPEAFETATAEPYDAGPPDTWEPSPYDEQPAAYQDEQPAEWDRFEDHRTDAVGLDHPDHADAGWRDRHPDEAQLDEQWVDTAEGSGYDAQPHDEYASPPGYADGSTENYDRRSYEAEPGKAVAYDERAYRTEDPYGDPQVSYHGDPAEFEQARYDQETVGYEAYGDDPVRNTGDADLSYVDEAAYDAKLYADGEAGWDQSDTATQGLDIRLDPDDLAGRDYTVAEPLAPPLDPAYADAGLTDDYYNGVDPAIAAVGAGVAAGAGRDGLAAVPDEPIAYAQEGDPSRSWGLGMKAMAAVLALFLIGGGGLFAYRSVTDGGSAGAPTVIKADPGPFKVQPDEAAAQDTAASPGSGVYQRLSGEEDAAKSQERIVDNREQPLNVGGAGDGDVATPALPKPVKTVIVKPDGTFVTRETPSQPEPAQTATRASTPSAVEPTSSDTAAASDGAGEKSTARVISTRPVRTVSIERQTETAGAGESVSAGEIDNRATSAAETIARANPQVVTSLVEAGAQGDPTVVGREAETASAGVDPVSVTPRPKPAVPATRTVASRSLSDTSAPANPTPAATNTARQASAQPAPAQPAPAQTRTAAGDYIVQVSSQRSRAQAESAYSDMQRRYPGLLSNQ
ncbi:MAG: hypothetical protein AAGF59_11890 [Pseudomonadota bacterium]